MPEKLPFNSSKRRWLAANRASECYCGRIVVFPVWKSTKQISVGLNGMQKNMALTMLFARTTLKCRPGIWSFSKPQMWRHAAAAQSSRKPFKSRFMMPSPAVFRPDSTGQTPPCQPQQWSNQPAFRPGRKPRCPQRHSSRTIPPSRW